MLYYFDFVADDVEQLMRSGQEIEVVIFAQLCGDWVTHQYVDDIWPW
jgi:hypothetical protein